MIEQLSRSERCLRERPNLPREWPNLPREQHKWLRSQLGGVRDMQGDVVQVLHKGKGRVMAEGVEVELALTQVD